MALTMGEEKRISVIEALRHEKIGVKEAGKVLSRSERQVYRILARVKEEGLNGVIHRNKGKKRGRQIATAVREKIIKLAKGKYDDINDMHLNEILKRDENIVIGDETLRQLLRGAGISPKRKRRHPKYRKRRERKESFGMMLQVDASEHDWLEGRGPKLTLVV